MRVHKVTLAALAVAASLSLAACQNDDDSAGKSDPSSGSTASSSGGGSGSGGEAGKCRTDELEITAADRSIDGDGEGTVAVTLKNGGGRDCTISGFAGVDLKTSEGALSAKRSGEPADPHVLKDGESTYFGVNYPINDSGGSGVRVTGLVVTPPNETKSVTLDWPGGGSLPVTDGSGSPVKVGPIGGIGQGG
ncbi:DUF4232 domain-containing protein [Streptomyces rapamycinicus]|uniref:DUF4232 domain-containing protein n=2 Tax=Streptomyces rapamycinicus TaxID=1226757 RepID=A0A0A0NT41_STRRN|nr:DUF4232 domain-containing protein [Streptomyces rapamycinicus]AGP59588.1 hypothetical protein M271_41055 [Streptomyces rapamycinicus NRRL 5491]MBB4789260.1 hypothetical protein [Streptomyces rapamycinicus]RLV77229.1 hypothetical protein D3C57_102630 [Streptomyces rapamycinicus NRRL 5491]UTO67286.1 DUF4232 domain-containing protein [Streptomyces rapamycinicus]UTP35244.1 DUF4232 domain-containing protein [Streptomyces rapamycinicus NRRL 5491]